MEIKATVPMEAWIKDAEAAGAMTDTFVEESTSLLMSSGFWGTVAAGVLVALKFIPQLAPAYSGLANIVGTLLAPKVHADKVQQIEEYAGHYIKTVRVIEDVTNQLPDSNGVRNVRKILKGIGDSSFHNAVATITADVKPHAPENIILDSSPSSKSQVLAVVK